MGKWVHRLSQIDADKRRAICDNCGPVSIRIKDSRIGTWRCNKGNQRPSSKVRKSRKVKGDICEQCGFVPEHPCQLDVDHIDGDHSNNDPSNLQTLCANCHRLKTYKNKDWE